MRVPLLVFSSALAAVIFIFSSPQTAIGLENVATVHGGVYDWYTLELLPNAIVEVNTTPVQKIVATDGTYSFDLPSGDYVIRAVYYEGRLLYGEENITIVSPGDFTLDIVMFPPIDENVFDNDIFDDWDFPEVEADHGWIYLIVTSMSVLTALVFLYRRRSRKPKKREPPSKFKVVELPKDLKEVLDVVIQNGGRITQKELRKKLPYSEAKVSLMVADLEDRGLLRKIKKGRGNILAVTT